MWGEQCVGMSVRWELGAAVCGGWGCMRAVCVRGEGLFVLGRGGSDINIELI